MTPLSAEVAEALHEADICATLPPHYNDDAERAAVILAAEVRRLHERVREEQERRLLADDTLLKAQNNAIQFMEAAKELRAELKNAVDECIKVVREQEFYPDTNLGTRQQWVKDEIAKKLEALKP